MEPTESWKSLTISSRLDNSDSISADAADAAVAAEEAAEAAEAGVPAASGFWTWRVWGLRKAAGHSIHRGIEIIGKK